MKRQLIAVPLLIVLLAGAILLSTRTLNAAGKESPMLAHMVYFSLNDNSDEARERLVASCRKHLSGHEGTVFFAAGTRAGEFDRPVNDRDFDVALHLVFKDKAAHDRYQADPRHVAFVEENKANWEKVRVFDAYVAP